MRQSTPSGPPQIGTDSNVPSTLSQSNSLSMRNQSTSYSLTNRSTTPRNATGNGTHLSLPVSEAVFENESSPIDKVGSNSRVSMSLIETVTVALNASGGMSNGDGSKSGKLSVLGKDGKAWTQFVGV